MLSHFPRQSRLRARRPFCRAGHPPSRSASRFRSGISIAAARRRRPKMRSRIPAAPDDVRRARSGRRQSRALSSNCWRPTRLKSRAQPNRKLLVPHAKLLASLGAGVASLAVLIWMIVAGPGYLGYGASLLWTGAHTGGAPSTIFASRPATLRFAAIRTSSSPRSRSALQTEKVRLYARYQSASKWEQVAMQPQPGGSASSFFSPVCPKASNITSRPAPLRSRHFNIRVVDLPGVKQIRVTYRYPVLDRPAAARSTSMAATSRSGRHRRPISKSSPTGRCAMACCPRRRQADPTQPGGAGQSSTRARQHRQRRCVPRCRGRSGPARAPLRRFFHRGQTKPIRRRSHCAAGPRLSRQPDRGSHGRGECRRRFRPERYDPALLRERRRRSRR